MRIFRFLAPAAGLALVVCTLFAQRPFRQYPAWEYYTFPLPGDWNVPGEWTFARLMYPNAPGGRYGRGFGFRGGGGQWKGRVQDA